MTAETIGEISYMKGTAATYDTKYKLWKSSLSIASDGATADSISDTI